jgi:DNA helicase-2/ATP-dependent DNA helicase PcrA
VKDVKSTPEQECFSNHGAEAFVEACPGAGKTRTIVARLASIAKTLPSRRAIAILSFTNSAVEKFAEDCGKAGLGKFLRFPHFAGTFDAFVRHFIVLPPGIAVSPSRPVIVDSWDSLGIEIRLARDKAFAGDGLSMDKFDSETGKVDLARIGNKTLHDHVIQHQADYEQAAARIRDALHRKHGLLSAADARLEASRHLQDANWSNALGKAIAARFHEVIVDEAQDCNPLDLEILSWLRSHNLRVTVVCDPDQAIYGFRHGSPNGLLDFAKTYQDSNRLGLTGNFRSSKPICALAATLRNRRVPDSALGKTANIAHPVIVAAYTGKITGKIGQLFIQRLESAIMGLSQKDGIVLAHKHDDAQRATGDPMLSKISGVSQIEAIARVVGEFWSPSATTRSRDSALRTMEKLLLILLGHWKQDADHHPSRVIERAKLNRRELRRQALEVLMHLPKTCDDTDQKRIDWVEAVRSEVNRLQLVLPQGQVCQHPP